MTTLTEAEVAALHEALDGGYRTWSTCDQVTADFGEALPFALIRDMEAGHIDALYMLFKRYSLPIPHNPYPGAVPRYGSLRAACAAGAEGEIVDAARYDRLVELSGRPDIVTLLRRLQQASRAHLPAFKRALVSPRHAPIRRGPGRVRRRRVRRRRG